MSVHLETKSPTLTPDIELAESALIERNKRVYKRFECLLTLYKLSLIFYIIISLYSTILYLYSIFDLKNPNYKLSCGGVDFYNRYSPLIYTLLILSVLSKVGLTGIYIIRCPINPKPLSVSSQSESDSSTSLINFNIETKEFIISLYNPTNRLKFRKYEPLVCIVLGIIQLIFSFVYMTIFNWFCLIDSYMIMYIFDFGFQVINLIVTLGTSMYIITDMLPALIGVY